MKLTTTTQVSVDGVTVTAPHPFPCWNGTTHAIAAPSPQVAGDIRYVFSNWSDGGAPSHDISCTASSNYTAMFTTQYAVVVQALPVGLRVVVDGTPHDGQYTGWWNASEAHAIDAPSPQSTGPDARWAWTSWSDGGVRSHRVSVTEPRTFIAPFSREFRVTVTTSPSGMRVSVDGAEFVAPQTFWWGSGTTHTLSAPEAQDHEGMPLRIGSWSDGGATEHTVTIVRPGSYVAKYGVAPLPVVMNWKPIVAAAFATVLLLVGIARSWGRPYAFREPRHRGLKTFLLFSLPIVVAEAATGVASLAFGVLAIPPLVGWGTAVDIGILAAGLVVVLARANVPSSSTDAPVPSEAAGR